jgi:hypothetical protein
MVAKIKKRNKRKTSIRVTPIFRPVSNIKMIFKEKKRKLPHRLAGDLPVGIGFGAERGVGLQFGIWVLRQVGHHGEFIHIGVNHLFGFDQLENVLGKRHICERRTDESQDKWRLTYLRDLEPIVGQAHGFSRIL